MCSVVSIVDMTNLASSETQTETFDRQELAKQTCLVKAEEDLHPTVYPELTSLSPRFFYRLLPVPDQETLRPEYVYVKLPEERDLTKRSRSHELFIHDWNNIWEVGRARAEVLRHEIPKQFQWVAKVDADIRFVRRAERHSYDAYAPLYHLLPRLTLERFGLPLLRRAIWPHHCSHLGLADFVIPSDFDRRLEEAMTYHLWPLLGARGKPSSFSCNDPIHMLSHNLDYWMPYLDMVAQKRARALGRTEFDDEKQKTDYLAYRDEMPPGLTLRTPLLGGTIWYGEKDALEAAKEMVEFADAQGDLRAILEAVRSHRIKDDFSERWSFEREDFERKLYSKRSKVKVTFVELNDTIPVHGPHSEAHENLLWGDFFTLLNPKERRIVVCLRNGETQIGDIAKTLGYANHSPISKRLMQIRRKAKKFFEIE